MINRRAYYKKDDGAYGISWCNRFVSWYIAPDSSKGQCTGSIVSRETDQCVHHVGNSWEYSDNNRYFKAGEGLLVSCLKTGKYISNGEKLRII